MDMVIVRENDWSKYVDTGDTEILERKGLKRSQLASLHLGELIVIAGEGWEHTLRVV